MIKIQFNNADVKDIGFGLNINGKSLSSIISRVLGTGVGEDNYGSVNRTGETFNSNSCDVIVTIIPHDTPDTIIVDGDEKNLEEYLQEKEEAYNEQSKKETGEEQEEA